MKAFLTQLLVLIAFYVSSQTGYQVVVRVTDAYTQEPIQNAKVILKEMGFQTEMTDYNGKAVFRNVPSRDVHISVNVEEYLTQEFFVNVSKNEESNTFPLAIRKKDLDTKTAVGLINDSISSEDLKFAELWKKKLKHEQRLKKKYPYGYVLYGYDEGVTEYHFKLNDADPRISADWASTEIMVSRDGKYFDLQISKLQWLKEDKSVNSTISINVGKYYKSGVAVPAKEQEIRVDHLVGNDVGVFFELLDDVNHRNFAFVLGFKK